MGISTRGRFGAAATAALTVAAGLGSAGPAFGTTDQRQVELPVTNGVVQVDPKTMVTTATTGGQRLTIAGTPTGVTLGQPGPVKRQGNSASWSYPSQGLAVTVSAVAGRLQVRWSSDRDRSMSWPILTTERTTSKLQIPRGAGYSVGITDPYWTSPKTGMAGKKVNTNEGMIMPFVSSTAGKHGASFITPAYAGNEMEYTASNGRLDSKINHEFSQRQGTRDWTSTFAITDGSPLAGALDYRRWMKENGRFTSMAEKIKARPEARKLLGAGHVRLFVAKDVKAELTKLRQLGVERLLGYHDIDQLLPQDTIDAAKRDGYLIGPYDTWQNAQDPKGDVDTPLSKWPGSTYPELCLRREDGNIVPGFGKRGCYTSSAAFAKAEPTKRYLANRIQEMTKNKPNAYFLDVDAAQPPSDDYSPDHPMNQEQDIKNRLARMAMLSKDRKLVLGGETGLSWASQLTDFADGAAQYSPGEYWQIQKDKEFWGGYEPMPGENAGASRAFKPVNLPDSLARAMFDPRDKLPLYDAVLHDSVVSKDRSELSLFKVPNVATQRVLTSMLYQYPLSFSLDGPTVQKHGKTIAALQRFFTPLHKVSGLLPMTDFRTLSSDRQVQRTTFGNGTLTVTANFGKSPSNGVQPGCVNATMKGDSAPRVLCPKTLGL